MEQWDPLINQRCSHLPSNVHSVTRHMACQSNRFRSGRLAECRVRSHCWAKATDQALDKAVSEACKMFGVPDIHDEWIFRAERLHHTLDSASCFEDG